MLNNPKSNCFTLHQPTFTYKLTNQQNASTTASTATKKPTSPIINHLLNSSFASIFAKLPNVLLHLAAIYTTPNCHAHPRTAFRLQLAYPSITTLLLVLIKYFYLNLRPPIASAKPTFEPQHHPTPTPTPFHPRSQHPHCLNQIQKPKASPPSPEYTAIIPYD